MLLFAAHTDTPREQSRTLLAYAAKQNWGLSPLPDCVPLPGGKPYFPQHPRCQFNLSHSGCYVLCGVGEEPLGIDIQIIKTNWRDSLPRRVCSPEELTWMQRQPDYWRAFVRLWCMKESRVKWDGSGLTSSIRDIPIPLPPQEGTLCRRDGLWFRLYSGTDWEACACCPQPPPEEIDWISL